MRQQYRVSRLSKFALAGLVGLSSIVMFTQPVEANTAKNNRVARRASRRGSQRARCKHLATKGTDMSDHGKTGAACPFKHAD